MEHEARKTYSQQQLQQLHASSARDTSPQQAAAAPQATQQQHLLASGMGDFVDGVVADATLKLARTRKEAMVSFVDDLLADATQQQQRQQGGHGGPDPPAAATPDAAATQRAGTTDQASTSASAARPAGSGSSRGGGRRGGSKPAWALSAGEATSLEEAEEAELLAFAEGLDLEGFLGGMEDPDGELRDAVQVRVG